MIKKLRFYTYLYIFCGVFLLSSPVQGFTQACLTGSMAAFSYQLFNPYAYFMGMLPLTGYPAFPLNYSLPTSLPCRLTPILSLALSGPMHRRAAATTATTLPVLTPLAGIIAPSPTALLTSFLFSPLPTTTTVTNTATFPGNTSYSVVPNNVSAITVQNYNYSTTVTTTPILPGLTSLFLPLLL